eukprot:2933783-Rhodomonas_salina.1
MCIRDREGAGGCRAVRAADERRCQETGGPMRRGHGLDRDSEQQARHRQLEAKCSACDVEGVLERWESSPWLAYRGGHAFD